MLQNHCFFFFSIFLIGVFINSHAILLSIINNLSFNIFHYFLSGKSLKAIKNLNCISDIYNKVAISGTCKDKSNKHDGIETFSSFLYLKNNNSQVIFITTVL